MRRFGRRHETEVGFSQSLLRHSSLMRRDASCCWIYEGVSQTNQLLQAGANHLPLPSLPPFPDFAAFCRGFYDTFMTLARDDPSSDGSGDLNLFLVGTETQIGAIGYIQVTRRGKPQATKRSARH